MTSSVPQQSINDVMIGKTLGRLGCGGVLHYDDARKGDWQKPLVLKIQIGDDAPIEIPIQGFELRREQGQQMTTRVVLTGVEI